MLYKLPSGISSISKPGLEHELFEIPNPDPNKMPESGSTIVIAGEPGDCGRLHPVPQPSLDPQHLGAQQLQPQQGDQKFQDPQDECRDPLLVS